MIRCMFPEGCCRNVYPRLKECFFDGLMCSQAPVLFWLKPQCPCWRCTISSSYSCRSKRGFRVCTNAVLYLNRWAVKLACAEVASNQRCSILMRCVHLSFPNWSCLTNSSQIRFSAPKAGLTFSTLEAKRAYPPAAFQCSEK